MLKKIVWLSVFLFFYVMVFSQQLTKQALTIKEGPCISCKIIGNIPINTEITVTKKSNNWCLTKYNDMKGWIYCPSLKTSLTNKRKKLILTSRKYLGKRYRFGATGPAAYDCSGFVLTVFSSINIKLPRTAAAMYKLGIPVKKEDVQAGDLVFFAGTYKKGISHVGIYISGDLFIHASSNGGIKISSLLEEYYWKHWVGVRRVIE